MPERDQTSPRIQLSTVITIVVVLVGAAWGVFTLVSNVEQRLEKKIERVEYRYSKAYEMTVRNNERLKGVRVP